MKKRYGIVFLALAVFLACFLIRHYSGKKEAPYLTVYGPVVMRDGMGRQSALLIDTLKDEMSIQLVTTQEVDYADVSKEFLPFLKKSKKSKQNTSKVALIEELVWLPDNPLYKKFIKNTSKDQIKIAYSMLESTAIPDEWVFIFNHYFDAIAVPDRFLIDVYKNCGVEIPIFEVPLGLYLKDYFKSPAKESCSCPFVFGNLSACIERKNHLTLVRAFARAFGDRNDVQLKMNCRNGDANLIRMIKEEIDHLGLHNVQFTNLTLNHADYLKLFNSFDCLVTLSKGEGFSVQPREAMALGIPTIVTDNTAQSTICASGYVRQVPSLKLEPAHYFWGMSYGKQFNCSVADAAEALLDIYDNYDLYLEKAQEARDWVRQYEYVHLKNRYLNLVKPKKVILGNEDRITDEYLMTTSPSLYQKYCKAIGTVLR